MMSLWDALRMNMMISYQELVRTFPSSLPQLFIAKRAGAQADKIYLFHRYDVSLAE